MRLIDADALDDVVQDLNENKNYGITRGEYKRIDAVLFEFSTIEPKKGEWIPITKGERGYSAGDFRCSVCHQPNKCYTMTNYCSHCGAYMKPTEKNDQ